MQKLFLIIFFFTFLQSNAQNIGIGTNTPDPSAKLDITSTNSGFLPPRMSMLQRDSIQNPAEGLMIFNITKKCTEVFVAGTWQSIYCYQPPNLTDIDGNIYSTTQICDQVWTSKNLDVVRYRNGDIIPQVTDAAQWRSLTTGAWCYYNNDPAMGAIYGKLYNWYAINDARGLAPQGWHVPSLFEYNLLAENCLGGFNFAGGAMKETDTLHWNTPNTVANNNSGFSGLPGGYRSNNGSYIVGIFGFGGYWWSSSDLICGAGANALFLKNDNTDANTGYCFNKLIGLSVRLVKD